MLTYQTFDFVKQRLVCPIIMSPLSDNYVEFTCDLLAKYRYVLILVNTFCFILIRKPES